jgi:hypothetical protein
MNSRGPLPQPDSRRGLSGENNAPAEYIQEAVSPPDWLAKKHHAEFQRILDKQHGAGVGTRQADADLYAQYVILLDDFRRAKSPEERQKARRVMAGLEDALVLGEKSQAAGRNSRQETSAEGQAGAHAGEKGRCGLGCVFRR